MFCYTYIRIGKLHQTPYLRDGFNYHPKTLHTMRKLKNKYPETSLGEGRAENYGDQVAVVTSDNWTLISALDIIVTAAEGCMLTPQFWTNVAQPVAYCCERLGFTNMQVVILAIMVEAGEAMSWRMIGNYLGLNRISIMVYTEEMDDLLKKRWIFRSYCHEKCRRIEAFELKTGVINALRHNEPFVPEKLDGLTLQGFMDKLENHLERNFNDNSVRFEDDEMWMVQFVKANPELPICRQVLKLDCIHDQALLLLVAYDYGQFADSKDEGLTYSTINHTFPDDWDCEGLRTKLRSGKHTLMKLGLIEHKCEDGIANPNRYVLTKKAKEELLPTYMPSRSKCPVEVNDGNALRSYTEIKEKPLFYNSTEEEQINRLTDLLSKERLPDIQRRLSEEGMRKGFACLFYGAPGTGKTETVLQIARKTGRNIMQVDIAGLRDKFVGESEKNIKAVFMRYKNLCRQSETMPILFFNEADGVFGKRFENVRHSVDKMDNAMQNIILEEVENLEGILIATTNLTTNLDSAFERRFLFKVEFKKPEAEVKTKIWTSMLGNLTEDDARTLATRYDFSGGQIENIARKRTIDYILYGKNATIDELENYCQAELLGKQGHSPIGFRI